MSKQMIRSSCLILIALIFGGCRAHKKDIPLFNYYIPKGDTVINGRLLDLSLQSRNQTDNIYRIGMYANNSPIGQHFFFRLLDSTLSEVRNYIFWSPEIINYISDESPYLFNLDKETSYVNSIHIFSKEGYNQSKSEFSFYTSDEDSLCFNFGLDAKTIKEVDILIRRGDQNKNSPYETVTITENAKCINNLGNGIPFNDNFSVLFWKGKNDTAIYYSYKLLEPFFDYKQFNNFHINNLQQHFESNKVGLLSEFYNQIISGNSYFDEIDERAIYVPEQKGDIPVEIRRLMYYN